MLQQKAIEEQLNDKWEMGKVESEQQSLMQNNS